MPQNNIKILIYPNRTGYHWIIQADGKRKPPKSRLVELSSEEFDDLERMDPEAVQRTLPGLYNPDYVNHLEE